MPWSVSSLTNNTNGANQQSVDTAPISPNGNRLLICVFIHRDPGDAGNVSASVSGLSLTWDAIESTPFRNQPPGDADVEVFGAMSGSSPGSGALTLTVGGTGNNSFSWIVYEVDGADISGTVANAVVQTGESADDTGDGTETATLGSAVTSGNRVFGVSAFIDSGSPTGLSHESGWTNIAQNSEVENIWLQAAWRDTDTDNSYTGSFTSPGASDSEAAVIFELAQAVSVFLPGERRHVIGQAINRASYW